MYYYSSIPTTANERIPCNNLYNTSNNPLFSGENSYFIKPEVYNQFVDECSLFHDKWNKLPYVTDIKVDMNSDSMIQMPHYSEYIVPGNWFGWDGYKKPDGWNKIENMYEVYPRIRDWFVAVTSPKSGYPTDEYIMKHAVLCRDPWKYRLSLIEQGYVECVCNTYYVNGVNRVQVMKNVEYYSMR